MEFGSSSLLAFSMMFCGISMLADSLSRIFPKRKWSYQLSQSVGFGVMGANLLIIAIVIFVNGYHVSRIYFEKFAIIEVAILTIVLIKTPKAPKVWIIVKSAMVVISATLLILAWQSIYLSVPSTISHDSIGQ